MGFLRRVGGIVSNIFGGTSIAEADKQTERFRESQRKQAADQAARATAERQRLERLRTQQKAREDAAAARYRESQRQLAQAKTTGRIADVKALEVKSNANLRALSEAETYRQLVEDKLKKAREDEAYRKEEEREQIEARKVLLEARVKAGLAPQTYASRKTVGTGQLPLELREFLAGAPFSRFASSNVDVIQFDPRNGGDLYIKFLPSGKREGRWYRYPRLGEAIAIKFYNAYSKGVTVWSLLRRPGVPFDKDTPPPADLPLRPEIDPRSSAAAFGAQGGF